ncbi:MAG: hypothetical protein IJG50_08615 [Clostridia bacterium]|nr:hypothetical protein [Clostridia bacterium]
MTSPADEIDIDLSMERLLEKEKRYVSMKRQKNHKRKLLNALLYIGYRPSIWRKIEWGDITDEIIYTDIVQRGKNSQTQKLLKKISNRLVRRQPLDALPPKGNYHRKLFDYWWIWI